MARWPTVIRLPSGLAHGRRTPEAPGSRPGFETSTCPKPGSACPHSRSGFLCPQKHAPGFFCSPKPCFSEENLGSACPHSRRGFLCPQKHAPMFFSAAKVLVGKTYAYRTDPNICWDLRVPIPAGALCIPKRTPRCFCVAKILFWGNRAAGAGGTSRRCWGNRPLGPHQPIPLKQKVRTPKASLVGEQIECVNHATLGSEHNAH